jgi:hypothetical protein
MKEMQRCRLCGACGDGRDGWSEDHDIVCLLNEKPCPARSYGCTAMIPKFQVGAHLRTSCPVAVSPCRLRRPGSTWNRCFNSDLVGGVYNSSANVAKIFSGSECCGARLRRLDLEQHYLFTHTDDSLVQQGCPYALLIESSAQFTTAENRTRTLHLEPASPLYPPRDGVERKSKIWTAKGSAHSAFRPNSTIQSDCASKKCSFVRKQLFPSYPKLVPRNGQN